MPHDVRTPNLSLTPLTPDTFDTLMTFPELG